jgi:hypothetical protein
MVMPYAQPLFVTTQSCIPLLVCNDDQLDTYVTASAYLQTKMYNLMLLGLSTSWFMITHILACHLGVYTLTYS